MTRFAPFDATDYLDDEETMAEYLTAALQDPNPDVFWRRCVMWRAHTAWRNWQRTRGLGGRAFTRRWLQAPNRVTIQCSNCFTHWESSCRLLLCTREQTTRIHLPAL